MKEEALKTLTSLARFEGTDPFEFISEVKFGGRRMPVFKVLYTNYCERNCLYCANRRDRDVPRYSFTPESLAGTFYQLYEKNLVKGIFISSGIHGNPLGTMEKILDTAEILRKKLNYKGFMHLKLLPGVDTQSIEKAIALADRVSINLEAPSRERLMSIAKEKQFTNELLFPLQTAHRLREKTGKKVGLCTQFVVGASGESDSEIIKSTFLLRKSMRLQRVYYSAFYPVVETPLEGLPPASKRREFRLYQAFYLMKFYGVKPYEFMFDEKGFLVEHMDPKEGVFRKIFGDTLIEVNTAPFEILRLVPGIGIQTARRIVDARRGVKIRNPLHLIHLGAKKKSLDHLLLDGRFYGGEVVLF